MRTALLIILFGISVNCFSQAETQKPDTIQTETAYNPELSVTNGEGNNTFKTTPQMLSKLLAINPTVEMIEATFPKWYASPVKKYHTSSGVIYEKTYTLSTIKHGIKIEFDSKRKVNKFLLTDFSAMEIKSFKQSLVVFGFRINASTSDLANRINMGVEGIREYYSKSASSVNFVLSYNQITIFNSKK